MQHVLDDHQPEHPFTVKGNRLFRIKFIVFILEVILLLAFFVGVYFKQQSFANASEILIVSSSTWGAVVFLLKPITGGFYPNYKVLHIILNVILGFFSFSFLISYVFILNSWPGGYEMLTGSTMLLAIAYILRGIAYTIDQNYKPIRAYYWILNLLFVGVIIVMGIKEKPTTLMLGMNTENALIGDVAGGPTATEVLIVRIILGALAMAIIIVSFLFRQKLTTLKNPLYKELNLMFVASFLAILIISYVIFLNYSFVSARIGFF